MITLSKEEVAEVQNYLLEIPAKLSLPLINFFNNKINQAELQRQQEELLNKEPDPANIKVKSPKTADDKPLKK